MSCVIGPPESCIVFGSWRGRSPLIFFHVCPWLVVFPTGCGDVKSRLGSTGEKMIGNVHCHRSTTDAEFSPEKKRGYGLTSRSSPVRRFKRVMKLPLFEPEKKTSVSFGSGAM